MSTIEEIERVIEKLPRADVERLSAWMAKRQRTSAAGESGSAGDPRRDHAAFLNSYAPEDEGLYDHAACR